MIIPILDKFISNYKWDCTEISCNVEGWSIIQYFEYRDQGGLTGIKVVYQTPPIGGNRRIVAVETNYEDVVRIEWANDINSISWRF